MYQPNKFKKIKQYVFSGRTGILPRRSGSQRKYLAPGLRPQRNAVGDRMTLQHTERIVIRGTQGQIVILGIAFQPALPFQVTTNPVRQGMRQL
jgi:hypothetical protein